MSETTDWFPTDIVPVRAGIYEVLGDPGPCRMYGSGFAHYSLSRGWGCSYPTLREATKEPAFHDLAYPKVWRGLTRPGGKHV